MKTYPKIGIRPTIDGRQGALRVRESLEEQTMNMAKSAAKLFTDNLKYSDGTPVQVVIADTTISRVPEAAACADKFSREGVAITLTVTPCWCYGSETMDMDKNTIKGVWGFNGTERPGAVYLAAVLAAHAQKGLPAFGIYGHDVQEADDTSIPDDVREKLLRFGRASIAVASMKGKSFLQIGSICMGIAGSIIDSNFMEEYLGLRVESVDEVEIIRRMTEGIYDKKEFEKALAWTKSNCNIGFDKNDKQYQKSPAEKEHDWEFVVKMALIIKDLMKGNADL
ncbi:MAG: L-fucose isomerase, partial [Bacteroidales bacterium]